MNSRVVLALLLLAPLGLAGCGDASEPESPTGPGASAPAADSSAQAEPAGSERTQGTLTLTVDGEPKSFTHFPADKNLAMSMSTMILARPSAEATEEFSMAVMSFNLRDAELPITLRLGMREAMESGDPAQFASTPKPLISYISPDGIDYSSYATVVFEGYDDGIATGRVENIQLEPADGDGPPVMLTDIRFEVTL